MTYPEALAYLDSFVNLERSALDRAARAVITLDSVRTLAARLGNPQLRVAALHVAGTKGKGSTCAMAERMLRAAGVRTGLYTSPHLVDVRERIQLDGAWISEREFAAGIERLEPHLEALRNPPEGQRRPTYFEILTHLAFEFFAAQRVELAVIEVGLGGRLDATNICAPLACGVSHISYDHQAILGETLSQIAGEKAGIFKPGVTAYCARQEPEALAVLQHEALRAGAPFIDAQAALRIVGFENGCARVELAPEAGLPAFPRPVRLKLPGRHQAENWALAVRLADHAHRVLRGAPLPFAALAEGSEQVYWPGRLERLGSGEPAVYLDGAHNEESVRVVLESVQQQHPGTALRILFGCARDKNVDQMLSRLIAARPQRVIFTEATSPRSKPPGELAARWLELGGAPETLGVCAEPRAALDELRAATGPCIILATGSLYLVGALKS